jgi:hypothetical protein
VICIVLSIALMASVAAAQAPERPCVPAHEPVSTGRHCVGALMCNLWGNNGGSRALQEITTWSVA